MTPIVDGNIDDREGAIQALNEHLLAHPEDHKGLFFLGNLTEEVGDLDSAERIYRRLLFQAPADSLHYSLASNHIGAMIDQKSESSSNKETLRWVLSS